MSSGLRKRLTQAEEIERKVVMRNQLGLHARAAGKLRNLASSFQAEIKVIRGNIEANAKSILGLMALEASNGTELTIRAKGEDAKQAIEAIVHLIENRFGEEE